MLKILGCLLIIISGTLSGQKICESLKQRIYFLEDFESFVFYARNEIEYKRLYPTEILFNFKPKSDLKKFFKKCITLIQNGENFPGSWEKTFNLCKFDIDNIVLNFGKNLGTHNLKNEIELCNLTINSLNFHIDKLRKYITNQGKVFIVFGTCIGIIIAILIV